MGIAAKAYVILVGIGGLISLAYGLWNLPELDNIVLLVLLVLLCGVAQGAQVRLFHGSSVSLGFGMAFVSLLLLGPGAAILGNICAAAAHSVFPHRRKWYKIIFNAGAFTMSAGLAGVFFGLAGGQWPVRDLASAAEPAAVAALTYFIVNTLLVSVVLSLTTGTSFRAVFNQNHGWLAFHYLITAGLSLLVPIGYNSVGLLGLVAFAVPLLLPWFFTRAYVAQIRAVIAYKSEVAQLKLQLAQVTDSRVVVNQNKV